MQQNQTINEVIIKARASIESTGYSKSSISQCRSAWNSFEKFSTEKGELNFSVSFGNDFLCSYYGITSFSKLSNPKRMVVRAIDMLNEVRLHGYIIVRRSLKGYVFPEIFRDAFEKFIKYREEQGIVPVSVQISKLYLERFAEYLLSCGVQSLAEVDMEVINGFIRSLSAYGKPTINHTLRSVRGILRYAYETGTITKDSSKLVPRIPYNRTARIPSAYTTDEINLLLSSADRSNPTGKRDYAAMVLASQLGLRASDICNLSFENIRWEENRIEIYQHKTGKLLTLPLVDKVGTALIDYLKTGRPETDSKNVLVQHVFPFSQLNPSTLYTTVSRYFVKAKISVPPGKKHGPHALRHSLASSLLEENTPLPIISEILGHVDTNTTSVYLKIDVSKLRQCALDVPFYSIGEGGIAYAKN